MASVPSTSGTDVAHSRCKYVAPFLKMLKRHPEIICFVLAVVLSCFSRYANRTIVNHRLSQTRQHASQPLPRRFFPASSPVIDFPYGNIATVGVMVQTHEALAVMYYAPWCAKSMKVRSEFKKAAEYLQGQIKFVGVNCWYKPGKCRQQNKFFAFPVLFFYINNLSGFKYNGLLRADYIVRFAESLLNPMQYLATQVHLASFLATSDNLVVGYFDFNCSPQPPGYQQFYYASMRVLEADPNNPIHVGVVTSKTLASQLEANESSTVMLFRSLNATLKYPGDRNFTSSAIVRWVMGLRQQPVVPWILPSGIKSITLSTELVRGPAVILFTPAHPLSKPNHHLAQLREVVLNYKNCEKERRIQESTSLSMLHRLSSYVEFVSTMKLCEASQVSDKNTKPQTTIDLSAAKQCCLSVITRQNSSCDMCLNYHPIHPLSSSSCGLPDTSLLLPQAGSKDQSPGIFTLTGSLCQEAISNYNPSEFLTLCCSDHFTNPIQQPVFSGQEASNVDTGTTDGYVRDRVDDFEANKCWAHRKQIKHSWMPSVANAIYKKNTEIRGYPESFMGSGCVGNNSLSFYAMDSRQGREFAKNLGVNLSPGRSSALVLVDIQNEAQFVSNKQVTPQNILSFIVGHTENLLSRSLRSSHSPEKQCTSLSDGDRVCIHQVTSSTFNQVVMDPDKDVVLLYYAPWCGFCAAFSHIYLSLAKYFRSTKHLIFARFNGNTDDLPWEFTADVYPVITFYPANKKVDSVSFPDHMDKSVRNLVQFVLSHASDKVRVDVALNICSTSCMKSNLQASASHVEVLQQELLAIETRLTQVHKRLQELVTMLDESADKDFINAFVQRIDPLQLYEKNLNQTYYRKQLQLKGVNEFRDILQDKSLLGANSLSRSLSASHAEWRSEWRKIEIKSMHNTVEGFDKVLDEFKRELKPNEEL